MVDRFAADAFDFSPEGDILLAGWKPINRSKMRKGNPKREKGLQKQVTREDAAFRDGPFDDDMVPLSLKEKELENRFRGLKIHNLKKTQGPLTKPEQNWRNMQDHKAYNDQIRYFGKAASDSSFEYSLGKNSNKLTTQERADMMNTDPTFFLDQSQREMLRSTMHSNWNRLRPQVESRLQPGESLAGYNRNGSFKVRQSDGSVVDKKLFIDGEAPLQTLAIDMLPGETLSKFTNDELYRWNTESFAPDIDPSGAVMELLQPIDRFDEKRWPTRQSGMFPPL